MFAAGPRAEPEPAEFMVRLDPAEDNLSARFVQSGAMREDRPPGAADRAW